MFVELNFSSRHETLSYISKHYYHLNKTASVTATIITSGINEVAEMPSTQSSFYSMNNTAVTVTDSNDDGHYVMSPEEYEEVRKAGAIFEAGMLINKYYLWPLFALGFPGNCAAIVTIFRMKSIGTFPVFVVMLAVMDSLAIFIKLLFYQLLSHRVDMGTAGCSLLRWVHCTCCCYKGQVWNSAGPRGRWRTEKHGENWLRNHLWCPNDPCG